VALIKRKKDDPHAKLTSLENRIAVCTQYAKLWHDYGRFFSEGLQDRRITEQEEQQFFQMIYLLASNHYRFTQLAGDYFKEGKAVLKVLSDTVSLQYIKSMSDAQFGQLLVDWHTLFIMMNKAIGKLKALQPPPESQVSKKGKSRAAKAAA